MPSHSLATEPPALRCLRQSLSVTTPPASPKKATPDHNSANWGGSPDSAMDSAGASSKLVAANLRDADMRDMTGRPRRRLSGSSLGTPSPSSSRTPSTADSLDTMSCETGGRALTVGSPGNTAHFKCSRTAMHIERRPSDASLGDGLIPSEGASLTISPSQIGNGVQARLNGGLSRSSFHLLRDESMRHSGEVREHLKWAGPEQPDAGPRSPPDHKMAKEAASAWRQEQANHAAHAAAGFSRHPATSARMS